MNNVKSRSSTTTRSVNSTAFDFQVFGLLLLASLLASLATIPYTSSLLYRGIASPWTQLLIDRLFDFVLLTLPMTSLGLWLGSTVGLGVPEIEAILNKRPNQRRLQSSILPAIILGTVGGIFIQTVGILSEPYFLKDLTKIELPGLVPSLLGSLGATVNEEIWLRLGVMTCLVWLGKAFMRQSKPDKIVMWSANLLTAFGFGILHLLPVTIFATGLSLFLTISILSLNGFVGVIFGWLYWRYGLLAAIIAHFSTNIVIYIMPALLSTTMIFFPLH